MRRVYLACVIGAAIATLVLGIAAATYTRATNVAPFASSADNANRGLGALIAAGDGQAYEAIARDPTFARPEALPSNAEAAYRGQRALFGELGWVVSLGAPNRDPIAFALLEVLSVAVATLSLGLLLHRRGVDPLFALAVLALPGVLDSVRGMTSESLQLALVTLGVLAWESGPRRTAGAVVALTLAVLTRESMLIVPLALFVLELVRSGSRSRLRSSIRSAWSLVIPFVAYAGMVGALRWRVGAWPSTSRDGSLSPLPFDGLIRALQHSPDRLWTVVWLTAGVLLVGYALKVGARESLYAIIVGFAAVAPFLGSDVWRGPAEFGRVLLPLYTYSAVIAVVATQPRKTAIDSS